MKVNVYKTKIMIFSKGQMSINLQFKYNGKNIEIVKDFNYLGSIQNNKEFKINGQGHQLFF
jgi:hypothetical protein